MNCFRKISLIGLAVLVMVTGVMGSTQTPTTYPTDFRLIGSLTAASGSGVSGYKVVFYQATNASDDTYTNGFAKALTDANGNFNINMHDDARLLELQPQPYNYYIGVVKKLAADGNSYGINEKTLQITAQDLINGYKIVDPAVFGQLVLNEGIIDPDGGPVPPDGTVPLSITRSGSDILISWEASSVSSGDPQIFVLTGSGLGDYNSTTGWTPVVSGQPYGGTAVTIDSANRTLIHTGQVAGGTSEVYYKALQFGTDATHQTSDPNYSGQTYLQTAWAVGKMNIAIGAGVNVVSIPFSKADSGVNKVISPDLLSDGDILYTKPASDNPNTSRFRIVNGVWVDDQDNPATLPMTPDSGYWIVASSAKPLTVWGNVVTDNSRSTLVKDSGILVIGCVYPNKELFINAGLNSQGGAVNKDVIYYKPAAASANTQKLTFDGTNWLCDDANETKMFTSPFGYWYNRAAGNGDYTLKHLKTY
jgi:hypothetical protein